MARDDPERWFCVDSGADSANVPHLREPRSQFTGKKERGTCTQVTEVEDRFLAMIASAN